jgi:hypothetical protein
MMSASIESEELGRRFIAGIHGRDWDIVDACLAPDVRFRAVVPNETRPFRDYPDAAAVIEQLRRWFDDADPLDLIETAVGTLVDQLQIRYRFTGHNEDGDFVIEQTVFAEMREGRLGTIRLVCSGFLRPNPGEPAPA